MTHSQKKNLGVDVITELHGASPWVFWVIALTAGQWKVASLPQSCNHRQAAGRRYIQSSRHGVCNNPQSGPPRKVTNQQGSHRGGQT